MNLGRRIIVIGSAGSGKSTLSLKLGEITALPVIHLDRLFQVCILRIKTIKRNRSKNE